MNRVVIAILVLAIPAGLTGCRSRQPQAQEQSATPVPATTPDAATPPPQSLEAPQASPAPAMTPHPATPTPTAPKPRGTPLPI